MSAVSNITSGSWKVNLSENIIEEDKWRLRTLPIRENAFIITYLVGARHLDEVRRFMKILTLRRQIDVLTYIKSEDPEIFTERMAQMCVNSNRLRRFFFHGVADSISNKERDKTVRLIQALLPLLSLNTIAKALFTYRNPNMEKCVSLIPNEMLTRLLDGLPENGWTLRFGPILANEQNGRTYDQLVQSELQAL